MQLLSTAILAGGSIIDLDGTLFVHIVVFFVAFFILRSLVFKPMVSLFEAREDAIDGARAEARQMEKDAAKKADRFDEEMRQVRLEAGEERDKLRQEGLRLERTVLEKVRLETQQTLASAEKRIEEEGARIRREIQTSVPVLARDMASKLLGREVQQ